MRISGIPPSCKISSRRSSRAAVTRRLGPRSAAELFDSMQAGDEIRSFRNSDRAWSMRYGKRGYALLRDGRVIKAIVTAIN